MPRGEETPAISAELGLLASAVERFCRRPNELLLAHEIGQQMELLAHLRDRLDLEFAELGGVFSATDEAEAQGSNGPVEWARHHCKLSFSRASELMVVGDHVAQMPESCDSMSDGLVGFGHLVQIARNARFCANSPTARFDEKPLLEKAVDESVSRFHHTCLAMRHSQDPEGYVVSEVNAVESRELFVYPQDDGMTLISARLDSTGAATVQTAIKALSKKLGPDDYRTSARRDADALIEIALYMLNDGAAADCGSQRPTSA